MDLDARNAIFIFYTKCLVGQLSNVKNVVYFAGFGQSNMFMIQISTDLEKQ